MGTIPNDDSEAWLDDAWAIVSAGLADGVDMIDGRSVADAFLVVIEDWTRRRVIVGDPADPGACRLRPRFSMLRDVHAGFDFLADIQLERLGQLEAGNLQDEAFRDLDRTEGMGQIASTSFLVLRARSHLLKHAAGGVVGMPEAGRSLTSLDAGEDGGIGAGIADERLHSDADEDEGLHPGLGILHQLTEGRSVLALDLEDVSSSAIIETAGLQLRRRLDPAIPSTEVATRKASEALAVTEVEVEKALDAAAEEHRNRVDELRQRRWDHPNMTLKTAETIDRQMIQATAAGLLWPIWGKDVARLFGLASDNAGQQRVTKYRKALPLLLPVLSSSLEELSSASAEVDP